MVINDNKNGLVSLGKLTLTDDITADLTYKMTDDMTNNVAGSRVEKNLNGVKFEQKTHL